MKWHHLIGLWTAFALAPLARAGESALTTTYQPLDGLRSGQIVIVPVTCHHWFANSASSAVDLISVRNVPPTDNPGEAHEDLNLASVCGVAFSTSDLGDPGASPEVIMDVTEFAVPERFGHAREDVIRACLECLRRCLPDRLLTTPLTLKCAAVDKGWLTEIVTEFHAHDRSKVFFESSW